ncbi:MAG: hypothetical protein FJX80_15375 [Bacteroidetes bacterium]|nr:hypothetical protein [Bacteroidota bacterium]
MFFIEPHLESILSYLNKLEDSITPEWGIMSAQRMVEHLSDSLNMAVGSDKHELAIPEEKLPSMLSFLWSDKPMAKNIQVHFAPENYTLRNESMEYAIDEFCELWINFETTYHEAPKKTALHPYYGPLDYKGWLRLHAKHFTHHFQQFKLV